MLPVVVAAIKDGLHLLILDADPDDLIFPRAATRVGPKYQANVPAAPGTADRPIGAHGYLHIVVLAAHNTVQISRNEEEMRPSRCSVLSTKCRRPKVRASNSCCGVPL